MKHGKSAADKCSEWGFYAVRKMHKTKSHIIEIMLHAVCLFAVQKGEINKL